MRLPLVVDLTTVSCARVVPRRSAGCRPDATGPAPAVVWPAGLARDDGYGSLVWLDMNHWIGLAKAAGQHPGGAGYRELLEAARAARARRSVTFVLLDTHYIEMSGIKDPRQRADVASVMAELTDYATMLGRPHIMRLEVQAALTAVGHPVPIPLSGPLFGGGVAHAFGRELNARITDETGVDLTEETRQQVGAAALAELMIATRVKLEWSVLAGPTDDEVPKLRQHGWDLDRTHEGPRHRCRQEVEQQERLHADPRWRRGGSATSSLPEGSSSKWSPSSRVSSG